MFFKKPLRQLFSFMIKVFVIFLNQYERMLFYLSPNLRRQQLNKMKIVIEIFNLVFFHQRTQYPAFVFGKNQIIKGIFLLVLRTEHHRVSIKGWQFIPNVAD